MPKKYIALPQGYISYSQWCLWKTSPEKYKAQYFDRRDDIRFNNSGQEYGKMVADALEFGQDTGDLLTDAAMLLLPKYDIADQEFFAEVKTKHGWLRIIAKPDSMNSETKEFFEFKTGRIPWTARKAQKHPQMIFYAVAIWLTYGVKNYRSHLAWIETEQEGFGSVKPTGHVQVFEVMFTDKQFLEVQADIINTALEIELAWATHVTKPWVNTF